MINKFKNWLIRKLGGYIEEDMPTIKTVPMDVVTCRIALPMIDTYLYRKYKDMSREKARAEALKNIDKNISSELGRYIIDNGLYERETRMNDIVDHEEVVYTVRVLKP